MTNTKPLWIPSEQRIADSNFKKYEQFLKKYPNSLAAKKELASILNSLAWDMVTAPEDSPEFDPDTGLKYALRMVELDPHPNYVDTLAEAYFASGQIEKSMEICEEMIKKYPGERMFMDRIKRCETLLKQK